MQKTKNAHRYKKLKAASQLLYRSVIHPREFPFWAYINLTRSCNLSCPYCYVLDDSMPDMDTADVIGVIDKLSELHTQWVSFTGGEPTLVKESLLAGVEHASRRKKLFTQLPTNGYLLDNDYLSQLGEAGLDLIDISMDALDESKSRKGLLDRQPELMDAVLDARQKYGFTFKVNTVVTRENSHKVRELLTFTRTHHILLSVRLGFVSPSTPREAIAADTDLFQCNDRETVQQLVTMLKSAKRDGYLITEPYAYFDRWEDFISPDQYPDWICEAATYNLNIDPNGMLRLCNNLPVNEGQLPLHYSELTKDYPSILGDRIAVAKKSCQPHCLAAAYFCSQHYRRHPHHFIFDRFFACY